jgi:bifunctional UDP-N-acetylglucosamine pyrophosphorylase/glucosamine-1-phosphate N-acetyltransferase
LIAPITVGKDAVVAAGTTANLDVEDGEMAIARARQVNKVNYGFKYKNK